MKASQSCLQVQGQTLVPAAAFMEMALGVAHKMLYNSVSGNTASTAFAMLSNAVLPAAMTLSPTAAVMDCVLSQKAGATELTVQSSTAHFRATILRASQQEACCKTGKHSIALFDCKQ